MHWQGLSLLLHSRLPRAHSELCLLLLHWPEQEQEVYSDALLTLGVTTL